MILVPQRLFGAPGIHTIFRDGNVCILEKKLEQSVYGREAYISNHVVSILLSGEQRIEPKDEDSICIKQGEVLFIPRGIYQVTDLISQNGNFHSLLFYFDDKSIQEFLAQSSLQEVSRKEVPSYLRIGQVPLMQLFVDAFMQLYKKQRIQNKSFLDLKIQELLHLLNNLVPEADFAAFLFNLTLPRRKNIKEFIEENYDKPLKIEDYAYLTGRSLSSFRRDFKSAYNATPQVWIKQKRMEKAVQLLDAQNISVTQLAYEVGYENISYFIQEFKGHTGLSPKQYSLSQHRNQVMD